MLMISAVFVVKTVNYVYYDISTCNFSFREPVSVTVCCLDLVLPIVGKNVTMDDLYDTLLQPE